MPMHFPDWRTSSERYRGLQRGMPVARLVTLSAVAVCALTATAIAVVAGSRATPGAPAPPPAATSAYLTASQLQQRQQAAIRDFARLMSQLTFRPYLPRALALPPGHTYDRVVWSPSQGDAPGQYSGFGFFVNSSDASMGHMAIHVDEALQTPDEWSNPRNPLVAFANSVTPVQLDNGVWYEMQQQHEPWQGSWILMARRGDVGIEISGLDPKGVLERFAATFTQ